MLVVLTTQIIISAVVLTPQPRVLMGVEILLINVFFLALNLRYRVRAQWSAGAAFTLLIRVVYVYSAVSLIVGVGGGFYALDVILLVTLARSMASCWTLLTALERGVTT